MIHIRTMTAEDVPLGMRLRGQARFNQTEADWRRFLDLEPDGCFVAENSRHRVCHYDRDGELISTFVKGDRTSFAGFAGCCNPMNLCFGPGGELYASESNIGRIKRFTPAGELLGLVGRVNLVPGCKNVAIEANSDGSRVYMLDITRNHIVMMCRKAEDTAVAAVQ